MVGCCCKERVSSTRTEAAISDRTDDCTLRPNLFLILEKRRGLYWVKLTQINAPHATHAYATATLTTVYLYVVIIAVLKLL